jgi:hypothetical protein
MPKSAVAEWLLARLTTPDRAAAIMGDLEELAASRGRLWFWTAYARALISLGWRTGGSAFILALVCRRLLFGPAIGLLMNHRVSHLQEAGLFATYRLSLRLLSWNVTFAIAQFLIFALPFVVVRFGWRDRLTQLVCALSLIAAAAYTFRPWFMDLSGILTVLAVVTALLLPLWRRPMIILAAIYLTAVAVVFAWLGALVIVLHRNFVAVAISRRPICDAAAFAVAAMVCVFLHRGCSVNAQPSHSSTGNTAQALSI